MRSLVAALAFLMLACSRDARPPFERANAAADAGDFREAAELYAQVRTPEAELRLANIEWRAFREHAKARARLQKLLASKEAFDAQFELARIALDRREMQEAARAAKEAERIAKSEAERRRARLAIARVAIEDGKNADALRDAIATLRAIIAVEGPRLEPARLLARAGLLLRDRAAMMEGIDGYYHVSAFSGPPHLIAGAYAELRDARDDAALARALAGIRFFDEAALVAAPGSEIARYAAMLDRMEAAANEHYRRIVLGDESARRLKKALTAELKTMWPQLDFDAAVAKMGERFGGYLITGETGGFADTHIAHKVVDRALAVEQYGRRASVRFIAVDGIVSNGFQSWRTDNRSGDGGWGTKSEIYQVRPLYADGPLRDWMRVSDAEVRGKYAADGAKPGLEGTARRLRLQYLDRLHAETKTRDAFLARVEADEFHYSIVLHEGRHAIDDASGESFDVWELEYRAKLSQVALADAPRPALASILNDVIGGDSPHGKANQKIVDELDAWMKTHAPEGGGVVHADRLTDDQIRAAFRSFEPLTKRER